MVDSARSRSQSWLLVPVIAASFFAPLVPMWGPPAAEASIMVALDLPELVRQAEHIAVVEVVSVRANWDERHERISSTIELKVMENWKASATAPAAAATPPAPERLTIVQPGGTVGDISMTVFGMGTFVVGERSLVFLRGPASRSQVVGMTQGKRALRYETSSRRWLVTPPDLRQTKLLRPSALPTKSSTPVTPSTPIASSKPVTPATPAKASTPVTSSSPALRSELSASADPARATGTRDVPLDDLRIEVKRLLGAGLP